MVLSDNDNSSLDSSKIFNSETELAQTTVTYSPDNNKLKTKNKKKNTTITKTKPRCKKTKPNQKRKETRKQDKKSKTDENEIVIIDSEDMNMEDANKTHIETKTNKDEKNYTCDVTHSDKKYTIILQLDNLVKKYYMDGDESADLLYKYIFPDKADGKLYFDDNKISKYLSISENGFVPGINYIQMDDSEIEVSSLIMKLLIQVSEDSNENIQVLIPVEMSVEELLKEINKKVEVHNKHLIFNGVLLHSHYKIKNFLESGSVLDLVLKNDLFIVN